MNSTVSLQIQSSNTAFQQWRKTSFLDRQKLLKNLAEKLIENKQHLAKLITEEMGKPISQSIAEIEKCASMTKFYADCENVLQPQKYQTEFHISEVHHSPMGIILGIMPWNFPFWQALRFAAPTILAGNTIILKHASICEKSGEEMQKLFLDSGFPEFVFTHIKISHEEVEEVLAHPYVKAVSLTGSESAGSNVASIAGKNIKKSVLELGGNDAFIVLDDANLKQAAKEGALARLQNCGQTCVAAKRFIIQKSVYHEFLLLFVKEYKKYVVEEAQCSTTKISGMAREDLADELEQQYNKALENGAEIIIKLERISKNAFSPGIIKMNEENPVADEELFGPLAMVFSGHTDEEILQIANNTKFGLANSVWTSSPERANFFIQNLESGTVSINQMTKSDARFPFGGTKYSGYGTELSLEALKEFTTKKTVLGSLLT